MILCKYRSSHTSTVVQQWRVGRRSCQKWLLHVCRLQLQPTWQLPWRVRWQCSTFWVSPLIFKFYNPRLLQISYHHYIGAWPLTDFSVIIMRYGSYIVSMKIYKNSTVRFIAFKLVGSPWKLCRSATPLLLSGKIIFFMYYMLLVLHKCLLWVFSVRLLNCKNYLYAATCLVFLNKLKIYFHWNLS